MKIQLEGQELLDGLYEVKDLLTAMENVNEEEMQLKNKFGQPVPEEYVRVENRTKMQRMRPWIIWGGIYLLLVLQNAINHASGPVNFLIWVLYSIAWNCIPFLAIAVIIFAKQWYKDRDVIKINRLRKKQYQEAVEHNRRIYAHNQKIQQELEVFHERKRQISKEYLTSVCQWYHEDYAFMEAVDFFIHELELGTATNLPEAIKNFREDQYRKSVLRNQGIAIDRLGKMIEQNNVIIDNQKILISGQQELIRQQMLGNMIAAATWNETRNIANNTREIANNTGNISRNTAAAARSAQKVADSVRR